jgi:hypothetical protein
MDHILNLGVKNPYIKHDNLETATTVEIDKLELSSGEIGFRTVLESVLKDLTKLSALIYADNQKVDNSKITDVLTKLLNNKAIIEKIIAESHNNKDSINCFHVPLEVSKDLKVIIDKIFQQLVPIIKFVDGVKNQHYKESGVYNQLNEDCLKDLFELRDFSAILGKNNIAQKSNISDKALKNLEEMRKKQESSNQELNVKLKKEMLALLPKKSDSRLYIIPELAVEVVVVNAGEKINFEEGGANNTVQICAKKHSPSLGMLRNMIKTLDVSFTGTLSKYTISDPDKKLLSSWVKQNQSLTHQEIQLLQQVHQALCSLFMVFAEHENIDSDETMNIVLNIMLLFCPEDFIQYSILEVTEKILVQVDSFIQNKANNFPKPISELFLLALGAVRKPQIWRSLVQKIGTVAIKAIKYDGFATFKNIESTVTKKQLERMIADCLYQGQGAGVDLRSIQRICAEVGVSLEQFTQMVQFEKKLCQTRKTEELVPNVVVFKPNDGLIMCKLPAPSKIALIMGNIINNCQHVGSGFFDQQLKDALSGSYHSFYVIIALNKYTVKALQGFDEKNLKEFIEQIDFENMIANGECDVLAGSYVWLTEPNNASNEKRSYNLVLDSLEHHPRHLNKTVRDNITIMLEAFAEKVVESTHINITSVLVGTGGGTNFGNRDFPTIHSEKMYSGTPYGDSTRQYIIRQKSSLKAKLAELGLSDKNIVSERQLQNYLIVAEELKKLGVAEQVSDIILSKVLNFPAQDIYWKDNLAKYCSLFDKIVLIDCSQNFLDTMISKILDLNHPIASFLEHNLASSLQLLSTMIKMKLPQTITENLLNQFLALPDSVVYINQELENFILIIDDPVTKNLTSHIEKILLSKLDQILIHNIFSQKDLEQYFITAAILVNANIPEARKLFLLSQILRSVEHNIIWGNSIGEYLKIHDAINLTESTAEVKDIVNNRLLHSPSTALFLMAHEIIRLLATVSEDRVKELLSAEAMYLYQNFGITVEEIIMFPSSRVANIADAVIRGNNTILDPTGFSVRIIKQLLELEDDQLLKNLLTLDAQRAFNYKDEKLDIAVIAKLSPEILKTLLQFPRAYKTIKLLPQDLIGVDLELIHYCLTDNSIQRILQEGIGTLRELEEFQFHQLPLDVRKRITYSNQLFQGLKDYIKNYDINGNHNLTMLEIIMKYVETKLAKVRVFRSLNIE